MPPNPIHPIPWAFANKKHQNGARVECSPTRLRLYVTSLRPIGLLSTVFPALAMEIAGAGFCAFGQLHLTTLGNGTQTEAKDSELVLFSDATSALLPVSVHRPAASDGIGLTDALTLVSVHSICNPLHVVVSAAWDATFIFLQCSGARVSLCSRKWLEALRGLSRKLGIADGSVSKVWECGVHHLLIRTTIGKLFITGLGADEGSMCQDQFPPLKNFVTVGRKDCYCLTEGGELYRTAFNSERMSLSLLHRISTTRFTKIASGADHILCLTDTGCVYSFGLGSRGQTGHGDIDSRQEPCIVEALAGIKIDDIACGHWHSLALSVYGDVYSWGWNEHGQLGQGLIDGKKPVVALPGLVEVCDLDTSFTSISCGHRHSAALTDTSILYLWGWNGFGQLASSEKDAQCSQLPSISGVRCYGWTTLVWK